MSHRNDSKSYLMRQRNQLLLNWLTRVILQPGGKRKSVISNITISNSQSRNLKTVTKKVAKTMKTA